MAVAVFAKMFYLFPSELSFAFDAPFGTRRRSGEKELRRRLGSAGGGGGDICKDECSGDEMPFFFFQHANQSLKRKQRSRKRWKSTRGLERKFLWRPAYGRVNAYVPHFLLLSYLVGGITRDIVWGLFPPPPPVLVKMV